jgi:hypothetical protein
MMKRRKGQKWTAGECAALGKAWRELAPLPVKRRCTIIGERFSCPWYTIYGAVLYHGFHKPKRSNGVRHHEERIRQRHVYHVNRFYRR